MIPKCGEVDIVCADCGEEIETVDYGKYTTIKSGCEKCGSSVYEAKISEDHAIEKYFNFSKYSHGEAVAIGMYYITMIGEEQGISKPGTASLIKNLLVKYNLPYKTEIADIESIINTIMLDKKFSGDDISLIFIKEIGEVIIKKINKNDLSSIISI